MPLTCACDPLVPGAIETADAVGKNSVAIVQVTVTTTSANDRYYKVRLCNSSAHTCGGPGQPPYVDCAEWLPPAQTSGLVIPAAMTLVVFVDPECDTIDFEVWRPAAGWVAPVSVRQLCATHQHPLTCARFPSRVCAAACEALVPSRLCVNTTEGGVAVQCSAEICCGS